MDTTVTLKQTRIACDCGNKHLVRWNYNEPSTKCPKTRRVILLTVEHKPEWKRAIEKARAEGI